MSDSERFLARALVSTTEGRMFGPGERIEGDFDPEDEHNARLISAGQIRRISGPQASAEAPAAAEGAEAPAEQQAAADAPAERAAAPEDGGEAPSPTIERMQEQPKATRRRGSRKA